MMKVHSFPAFEIHTQEQNTTDPKLVPMFRARRGAREPLIIDGPFAETKESCSHVAILARRRTAPEAANE